MAETKDVAQIFEKVKEFKRLSASVEAAQDAISQNISLRDTYVEQLSRIKVTEAEIELYDQIVQIIANPSTEA